MQESMPEPMPCAEEPLVPQKKTKTVNTQINFPNTETKEQKRARKQRIRDVFYRSQPEPLILANISKNHIDYGMSPSEHLSAKAERLA